MTIGREARTRNLVLCAPGGASCAERIAEIMGVEVKPSFPYRAVVHCWAGWSERLGLARYVGEPTCAAANLVSGYQGCTYGRLGLGDCVRVCDYDAIHVTDGLARVDYRNYVGCKACAWLDSADPLGLKSGTASTIVFITPNRNHVGKGLLKQSLQSGRGDYAEFSCRSLDDDGNDAIR